MDNKVKDLIVKSTSSALLIFLAIGSSIFAFALVILFMVLVILFMLGAFSAIVAVILYTIDLVLGTSFFSLPHVLIAGAVITILKIILYRSDKT